MKQPLVQTMTFCKRVSLKTKSQQILCIIHCHPQTLDVLRTRAEPLGIEVCWSVMSNKLLTLLNSSVCYCNTLQVQVKMYDYAALVEQVHVQSMLWLPVSADLLALTVLKAPGNGVQTLQIGTAQRFGDANGLWWSTRSLLCKPKMPYKRDMPGRVVGCRLTV